MNDHDSERPLSTEADITGGITSVSQLYRRRFDFGSLSANLLE